MTQLTSTMKDNEPKTNLRLVVLGGDCAYSSYAADIILRSDNKLEMTNKRRGNIREKSVTGRQVSLFLTPSYWMNHLALFWFFTNGVESIRESIQDCTSIMFPGPHAFLLVMRAGHTSGKEHLLLKAITHMFGAEVLEYTMVLFIYGTEMENKDALKNRCVKMCGTKYFMLENNDENVEELFRKVEAMTQRKKSRFFIQPAYENLMKVHFEPWEIKLRRELEELKIEKVELKTELYTIRQTERDLREELKASRNQVSALQKELDTAKDSEKQLRMGLRASRHDDNALHEKLDMARRGEKQLRKEQAASRRPKSALGEKLDTAQGSERQSAKELGASRHDDSELQEDLYTSRCSEKQSRKETDVFTDNEAGQWKYKRRNSKKHLPPYMENQNKAVDDL